MQSWSGVLVLIAIVAITMLRLKIEAVECDRQRHKRALVSGRNALINAENGQSTVEYA